MHNITRQDIPQEVAQVTNTLEDAGYEAYLVGGCVRDLLRNTTPKDWDITTNATPEQIIATFGEDETFYENNFGTVGIKVRANSTDKHVAHATMESHNSVLQAIFADEDGIIEVTPYRTEGSYSNKRHPDTVSFSKNLSDDLKRRDFTVNALAFRVKTGELADLHGGLDDLQAQRLRAVGVPRERFNEDALRMLRAIRFSAQLGFTIDADTMLAIAESAQLLEHISQERIRDEFNKLIMSDNPALGLGMAEQLGLLQYMIPELREGIGCQQGKKAHKYDVFEHLLRSLQHAADKNLTLVERLSALFHDIGKPRSRRKKGDGYTFYGHEVIGARMVREIMDRLHYDKVTRETVTKLVRWHMFFSDPDTITLSAVRRMITNVGQEHIQDLLRVRMCDRIGSGRPKEQPFRFRKYMAMVDEALRDPITVGMLAIDGTYIMERLHEKPGPRIGWILHALLEDVLDNPAHNTQEYLHDKASELVSLDDSKLKELGKSGQQRRKEVDKAEIAKLHEKHHVS